MQLYAYRAASRKSPKGMLEKGTLRKVQALIVKTSTEVRILRYYPVHVYITQWLMHVWKANNGRTVFLVHTACKVFLSKLNQVIWFAHVSDGSDPLYCGQTTSVSHIILWQCDIRQALITAIQAQSRNAQSAPEHQSFNCCFNQCLPAVVNKYCWNRFCEARRLYSTYVWSHLEAVNMYENFKCDWQLRSYANLGAVCSQIRTTSMFTLKSYLVA